MKLKLATWASVVKIQCSEHRVFEVYSFYTYMLKNRGRELLKIFFKVLFYANGCFAACVWPPWVFRSQEERRGLPSPLELGL